jgi:hypothetical protein
MLAMLCGGSCSRNHHRGRVPVVQLRQVECLGELLDRVERQEARLERHVVEHGESRGDRDQQPRPAPCQPGGLVERVVAGFRVGVPEVPVVVGNRRPPRQHRKGPLAARSLVRLRELDGVGSPVVDAARERGAASGYDRSPDHGRPEVDGCGCPQWFMAGEPLK